MNHDDSNSNPWDEPLSEEPTNDSSSSPQSPSPHSAPQSAGSPGHAESQAHGSHAGGPSPSGHHTPPQGPAAPSSNSMSTMAILCAVAGFFGIGASGVGFCCCLSSPVGVVLAAVAMVLAFVEWKNIESGQTPEKNKTLIMIGGGLGALGLLLSIGTLAMHTLFMLL